MSTAVESAPQVLQGTRVHDVDSHVVEVPDLWTSRVHSKWGDVIPHVEPTGGPYPAWFTGTTKIMGSSSGMAHPDYDADTWAGADDPKARLHWMDGQGIYSQVLYPNLIGFFGSTLMKLDPELRLACYQAYNDYLTEFASCDPDRLIPLANLPFWDIGASVAELERCHAMGHRGINFGFRFEQLGLPRLRDEHWDPVLRTAEEMGLAINFHVGFNGNADDDPALQFDTRMDTLDRVKTAAELFSGNIQCIGELIMSGLCHRYPSLRFVSVESGVGFVPYLLEALDWQFRNQRLYKQYPDWLLPSEYFRRQVYGTFWFEEGVARLADLYPDNFMFSSDYPHPTSLTPIPDVPYVLGPRATIEKNLAGLPEPLLQALVHDNAATVYNLTRLI